MISFHSHIGIWMYLVLKIENVTPLFLILGIQRFQLLWAISIEQPSHSSLFRYLYHFFWQVPQTYLFDLAFPP